ncbi:MAG: helix-hairpin-helix domain-containing protein [Bulleidia sp.]
MKQLLIFFVLLVLVLGMDLKALDLSDPASGTMNVTVTGEALHPGTYELPMYAVIQDVLDECGTTENADISTLNPNLILKDQDVVHIPAKSEDNMERISINSATAEQLCSLPGIGETMANRIIDYRNEHGLFQSIEEIMNVKGIGQAKFEKIRDRLTL